MHVRDTDNSLLQQWDYNYDLIGNVTKRKEALGLVEENYAYDTLNRLTSANLVNAAQLKGYAFDAIGNVTQKTDVRPWSLTGNAYQYLGGKPHAVSQISGRYLANPEYFYYDANGASFNWSGKNISYTGFNMPSQITSGASNYTWAYDANYSRAKYVTPAKTVIYLREGGGPTLYQKITKSDGTVQHRNLIVLGKRLVAQVTTTIAGGNSITQTHYLHGDALNSITLVTDQNAQVVERFFYNAYGKRRRDMEGAAAVMMKVNWAGDIVDPILWYYTPHEIFGNAALEGVRGASFEPHADDVDKSKLDCIVVPIGFCFGDSGARFPNSACRGNKKARSPRT